VIDVLKAYLGWANEETHGGESLRLYALDKGPSPRWDKTRPGGRTIERGLIDNFGTEREGDRYLVVRLGDRFVSDKVMEAISIMIQNLVRD
jgi:hypothetical protein